MGSSSFVFLNYNYTSHDDGFKLLSLAQAADGFVSADIAEWNIKKNEMEF